MRRGSWPKPTRLIEDHAEYTRMSRIHNPYGDGHAAARIVAAIGEFVAVRGSTGARRGARC